MRSTLLRIFVGGLVAMVLIAVAGELFRTTFMPPKPETRARVATRMELAKLHLDTVPLGERAAAIASLEELLALELTLGEAGEDGVTVQLRDGTPLAGEPRRRPQRPVPYDWLILQSLLGLLGFAAVFAWLGRPLARDLQRLERTADRIARGDLRARAGAMSGPLAGFARQFDAMGDRVERMIERQNELLAAVSHELRTPLARIRFRLLEVEARAPEAIDRIDGELDLLDRLIDDLLEVVRLDGAGEEDPATPEVAASVVARWRDVVDLELKLVQDGVPPLSAQAMALIVDNLVSNAVGFAASTVSVAIDARSITVEDDGAGIPEAILDSLFEPFVVGDASRSRATGGVGLGLALVERAARRSGAVVGAENTARGARLRVTWPG